MILTIYTDGASRGNPGKASYGFVVFKDGKKKIHEEGKYLGIKTNNFAEYTAILKALEYVKKIFPLVTEIKFYMDSKLVSEQLSGRYKIKSPNLIPLISQIRALVDGFEKISYQHIPRSENYLADKQANRALDELK